MTRHTYPAAISYRSYPSGGNLLGVADAAPSLLDMGSQNELI